MKIKKIFISTLFAITTTFLGGFLTDLQSQTLIKPIADTITTNATIATGTTSTVQDPAKKACTDTADYYALFYGSSTSAQYGIITEYDQWPLSETYQSLPRCTAELYNVKNELITVGVNNNDKNWQMACDVLSKASSSRVDIIVNVGAKRFSGAASYFPVSSVDIIKKAPCHDIVLNNLTATISCEETTDLFESHIEGSHYGVIDYFQPWSFLPCQTNSAPACIADFYNIVSLNQTDIEKTRVGVSTCDPNWQLVCDELLMASSSKVDILLTYGGQRLTGDQSYRPVELMRFYKTTPCHDVLLSN